MIHMFDNTQEWKGKVESLFQKEMKGFLPQIWNCHRRKGQCDPIKVSIAFKRHIICNRNTSYISNYKRKPKVLSLKSFTNQKETELTCSIPRCYTLCLQSSVCKPEVGSCGAQGWVKKKWVGDLVSALPICSLSSTGLDGISDEGSYGADGG